VFDGKRYKITAQSWHKNDEPAEVQTATPKDVAEEKDDSETTTYIVQEEEDIYVVAVKTGASPSELRKLNGLTSPDLQVGQVLRLPLREPPPGIKKD